MRSRVLLPVVLAALAHVGTAQCDFPVRVFPITKPVQSLLWEDNVPSWIATFTGDATMMLGGSLRSQHASMLNAAGALSLLQQSRTPFVVSEANSNNLYGLTFEGTWVPNRLPSPPTNFTHSETIFAAQAGDTAWFFNPWLDRWVSEKLNSSNVTFVRGRGMVNVVDGGDSILGFGVFEDSVARLNLPSPRSIFVKLGNGSDEPPNRRNMGAFEIGDNELAIYSPYKNSWIQFVTTTPIVSLSTHFDKNVAGFGDGRTLWAYSAITGKVVQFPIADASSIVLDDADNVQDFAITALDPATGNFYLFRGIDGGFAVLPGVGSRITSEVLSNNLSGVAVSLPAGGTEYYAASASVRGAQFVAAGLTAGETVIDTGRNDNTFLVTTDQKLYGYSGFTNRWTSTVYRGVTTNQDTAAEDFIGKVETTTHIYVFSPREDKWIEFVRGPNTGVEDEDELVILTEPNQATVYGSESDAPRTQLFQGSPVADGKDNSYYYAIRDRSASSSTVYWYQTKGDVWTSIDLPVKGDTLDLTAVPEDGLITYTNNAIYAFSSWADVNSSFPAPHDNYAFHTTLGSRARFLAKGTPNTNAILLVGSQRASIPSAVFDCGVLQVNPIAIDLPLANGYDSRGLTRFTIDVPNNVGSAVLWLQMVSVDLPSSTIRLGRGRRWEIF